MGERQEERSRTNSPSEDCDVQHMGTDQGSVAPISLESVCQYNEGGA